jgi:FMN phosphatase YigB (HAD superfamily)
VIVNKEKVILTDCDGVLLDWFHGFLNYAQQRGHDPIQGKQSEYKIDEIFGLEKSFKQQLVQSFNESAWMRDLSPLRDAVKYVRKLHEEHGYVFHCITSQSDDPKARLLRVENLETVFGKGIFEYVECLPCGADKDDALEKYRDTGCWWIEDKMVNCDVGIEMGLNGILIAHEHNADYKGEGIRVQTWKEVYETITG